MKSILIIADGLGGRPTDINGKTCLEAADTPTLDELASRGAVGLMDPIKPGIRPGSDTAHLSIFGYDPYHYYTGRGVFEAAGIGMEVRRGDVCFRTNFATVDQDGNIVDRRAGRISEGQDQLSEALQNLCSKKHPDVEVHFERSTEHRGALCLRGEGLGDNVSDTDPHQLETSVGKCVSEDEESDKTAEIINELTDQAREILSEHPLNERRKEEGKQPANALLARGSASYPDLPSLEELYGVKGTVIAAGALYIGVARVAGMKVETAEGATGTVDSKIINKVKLGVQQLQSGEDLIFIHFKGADNASHDHDAEAKVKFIEKIDHTFSWLRENLDWEETHLAFAGDHTSPIQFGDHSPDPVPAMLVGPNVRKDEIEAFDEFRAAEGGLNRFSGQLLPMVLSLSNFGEKFGA
ncbi:MAG: 2,3-bisphosphoglycerate-independent phosphoglycerate mutase [Candidatus Acetothermia bacterium]